MVQTAKIIGLRYLGKVCFAMYVNLLSFTTNNEKILLEQYAGISSAQAAKFLLIAPLQEIGGFGEVTFTNMPGTLNQREPYCLAFQFIRDRWDDIPSGSVLNTDLLGQSDNDINSYMLNI